MTPTNEAFAALMPEPKHCVFQQLHDDSLGKGWETHYGRRVPSHHTTQNAEPLYTADQMRQMFDAATERAAKLCENEVVEELTDGDLAYNMATRHCAAAIRGDGGAKA